MRRRKDYVVCIRTAWAVALIGGGAVAIAQGLLPEDDGWYAWTIDARSDDQRCCFEWDGGEGRSTVCKLDGRGNGGGYGAGGQRVNPTGTAVVYVKQKDGRVEKATALSASCQVSTRTPVKHLDDVSLAQGVALLLGAMDRGDQLADEALSALAAYAAQEAQIAILGEATKNDDEEVRNKAWFWLAQTKWSRTEQEAMEALRTEPSRLARHGAIFALSRLPNERSADALIKVVETAKLERADRKQALFWLAQDENPRSLDYLSDILSE